MIRDDRSSVHIAGGSFESFDMEAMARAPSLPETVAGKLRDAILSDQLRPGQRALLGGPTDGMRPDLLAAIEQHRTILEGLHTRNPGIAREKFVRVTLQFWKEQHHGEIGPLVTPPHDFHCGSI